MTRTRILLVLGSIAAVVLVVGYLLLLGYLRGGKSAASAPQPEPTQTEQDDYAEQAGEDPLLLFTGWDEPIGKGGTLAGVMDMDSQDRLVADIDQDYRKRHADAPRELGGTLENATFDSGANTLHFDATIKTDTYTVDYDAGKQKTTITRPDGTKLGK